jgi:hypothetical protein
MGKRFQDGRMKKLTLFLLALFSGIVAAQQTFTTMYPPTGGIYQYTPLTIGQSGNTYNPNVVSSVLGTAVPTTDVLALLQGGWSMAVSGSAVPFYSANLFPATNYGSCKWSASGDVGPCVNAAIAAAASVGGGDVVIPATGLSYFGIQTQIVNSNSGVHLRGAGLGTPRDNGNPNKFLAATRLVWTGGATANPMALIGTVGATQDSLYAIDTTGIVFDCNNLCGIGVEFSNVAHSTFYIGGAEATSINIEFTTPANGTGCCGNQDNDIWAYSRSTSNTYSPTGILLDGGVNGGYNTSINRYRVLYAWYNQGDGIVFGNQDNDLVDVVQVYPNPGATGRPTVFANSNYTPPNGVVVNGVQGSNDTLIHHAETQISMLGFRTGATVTTGVGNTGTTAVSTTTLTTNGTTATGSYVLNFASTTGVAAKMATTCGAGYSAGIPPNDPVVSTTGSTVTLLYPAVSAVASSVSCAFSFGAYLSTVKGTYTVQYNTGTNTVVAGYTCVNANWCISAPAGGTSQSNISVAAGALSFTDLYLPVTGTPNNGDNFTIFFPTPSKNVKVESLDQANNIPLPFWEYGTTGAAGYTGQDVLYNAAGGMVICNQLASCAATGLQSIVVGGANGTASQTDAIVLAGAGNTAGGFGSAAGGHNNQSTGTYTLAMGESNTVSGTVSTAVGESGTSTGSYNFMGGYNAADRGRYAVHCFGSIKFATVGDDQSCFETLHGTGASTTAIRLTADAAAAGAANCVNLPNNTSYVLTIDVNAFDHTTVSKSASWNLLTGLLVRGASAATTALNVASATPTATYTNGTLTGEALSLTADTTNGCLNISYTPPTGNTDTWNIVAYVRTLETQ